MNKFNMFITAVCVLFLIKLRWPKNKSIYDTVVVVVVVVVVTRKASGKFCKLTFCFFHVQTSKEKFQLPCIPMYKTCKRELHHEAMWMFISV